MAARTYKKRKNCATMDGEWYEVLAAMLAYLRLRNNAAVTKFSLAANVDNAGAFDDVVFNYTTSGQVWHTCFVQAKHKVRAKLGLDQLIAGEKKDFSLRKYLASYNVVKGNLTNTDAQEKDVLFNSRIENVEFVLFTNAPLHESLKHKKTHQPTTSCETSDTFQFEDLLKSRSHSEAIFKFTAQEDESVFKHLASTPGAENLVKEFFGKLTVFSGQSNVNEISVLIKDELLKLCPSRGADVDRIYEICKSHFQVWWRDSDVIVDETSYVIGQCLEKLDFERESFKHLDSYRLDDVHFTDKCLERLHASMGERKSFVHIVTSSESLKITTTKIQRMFEVFPELVIYSTVEYFIDSHDLFVNWASKTNDTIVLVSDSKLSQEKIGKFETILRLTLNKNQNIILVTVGNDPLVSSFQSQIPPNGPKRSEEHFSFNDLDDKTKEIVRNITVPFPTDEVSLKSLFNCNINKLNDFLSENPNLAASLMTGAAKPIGQSLPSDELPPLIPRSLRVKNVVASNIFKSSESTEVFLVTGATVDNLEKIFFGIKFQESRKMFSMEQYNTLKFHKLEKSKSVPQNSSNSPLFLVIEDEDASIQFNQLGVTYSNVHWLHVESESKQLIWKGSMGNIQDIKLFTAQEESVYEENCILSADSEVEIVIGEPGMGKTTLMENTARVAKKEKPEDWVVFVKLRQHSETICDETEAVSFLALVGLSSQPSQLEMSLFNIALNEIGNVIVICDGLDEICPQYEEEVFNLLEQIQKTKVKKLIISSRLCLQNTLETRFAMPAKEIVGLTEEEAGKLLNHYGNDTLQESIQYMNTNGKSLLRVPLFARLFAEVFADYDENSQKCLETINLFKLVQMFVEKKFKLYYFRTSTGQPRKVMETNFFKNHYIAALNVFNDDADLANVFLDKLQTYLDGLERGGIVLSVTKHIPSFIHLTFASYFAAFGLLEYTDEIPNYLRKYMFINIDGVRFMCVNMLAKDSELHKAVLDQNIARVEELLSDEHCNVDAVDKKGRQAIHLASSFGFQIQNDKRKTFIGPRPRHIVEILLDKNASVDCKDDMFSWTPLQYALETGSFDAAEFLLAKNADTVFSSIPETLLSNKVLCSVINNGFTNLLKFLVPHVKFDDSVLVAACEYGDPDMVEALLAKNGNTEVKVGVGRQTSMLHLAIEYNHVHLFERLLKDGDINKTDLRDETYLHAACRGNSVRTIEYLISRGADVDSQDNDGSTPLFSASRSGKTVMIEALLSHGADIDKQDRDGLTPLYAASLFNNVEVVEMLVARGADVDRQHLDGSTPLYIASGRGHVEVVKVLISHGADVDRQDKGDRTPLYTASWWGKTAVVEVLIANGADLERQYRRGETRHRKRDATFRFSNSGPRKERRNSL